MRIANILAGAMCAAAIGLAAPTPGTAQSAKYVEVLNRASLPIYHLWISSSGLDEWGPDQLGYRESIGVNRYRTYNIRWNGCLVDLRAELSDGARVEYYQANVCGGSKWTVYDND